MSLLVDTSVWSLAFRRDSPPNIPEVIELKERLQSGNAVFTTGLVLQELLQGFRKPKAYQQIITSFQSLPLLVAERMDYICAAELRNNCRGNGIQIGTVDALLAQLCLHHDIKMLTTDKDFSRIADLSNLSIWSPM